ncbi:unnamed protein product [Arctogadus glacialis]
MACYYVTNKTGKDNFLSFNVQRFLAVDHHAATATSSPGFSVSLHVSPCGRLTLCACVDMRVSLYRDAPPICLCSAAL